MIKLVRKILRHLCFTCAYLQFKCHSGLFTQAETDRSVLSDSDSRGGEPGESRSSESCPHLSERERSGSKQHTENSNTPGKLLHGEDSVPCGIFLLPFPFPWFHQQVFKSWPVHGHINRGIRSLKDTKLLQVLWRSVTKIEGKKTTKLANGRSTCIESISLCIFFPLRCVDMQSRWKVQSVGALSSTAQTGKTSSLFQVIPFSFHCENRVVFYYLNFKTLPCVDKDTTTLKVFHFNSSLIEHAGFIHIFKVKCIYGD